jgi:hypothetical protein
LRVGRDRTVRQAAGQNIQGVHGADRNLGTGFLPV